MDKPLISVIVTTCCRHAAILRRALMSVVMQTYRNIDIIVIDDTGTENSAFGVADMIATEFPQIRYYSHACNMGVQNSRNEGVLYSRGEYIAFLDDDDEWFPSKLEEQLYEAQKQNAVMVFSNGLVIYDDSDQRIKPYSAIIKKQVSTDDLLFEDCIGSTSHPLMLRKAVIGAGLFDINQPARQDYDMWIRLSRQGKCIGINKFHFVRHIHNGEQISRSVEASIIGYSRILEKNEDYYSRHPFALAKKRCTIIQLKRNDGQRNVDRITRFEIVIAAITDGKVFLSWALKRFIMVMVLVKRIVFGDSAAFKKAVSEYTAWEINRPK